MQQPGPDLPYGTLPGTQRSDDKTLFGLHLYLEGRCENSQSVRGPDIDVARSFDWVDPNHKSHAMTSSKYFEKRTFCGTKKLEIGRSKAVA